MTNEMQRAGLLLSQTTMSGEACALGSVCALISVRLWKNDFLWLARWPLIANRVGSKSLEFKPRLGRRWNPNKLGGKFSVSLRHQTVLKERSSKTFLESINWHIPQVEKWSSLCDVIFAQFKNNFTSDSAFLYYKKIFIWNNPMKNFNLKPIAMQF